MARPIVLSNGELHVGINNYGMVHDFYFPYVGFENHASGKDTRHHIGVWIDGEISWLDNTSDWNMSFSYPHDALIGHIIAKNDKLGIIIEFDDTVDAHMSAFMRNIHIINTRNYERTVRVFLHQAFAIGDSRSNTDTAQYLPDNNAVLHYRGRRALVIGGIHDDGSPFDQHTIGLFGIEGAEGTYRDAEDGELNRCDVEHGRVDSTIRFVVNLAPFGSRRIQYWIAAGTSNREALYIHKQMQDLGVQAHLDRTASWWQEWLKPAYAVIDKIPKHHQRQFLQSLMIIKSQTDKRGAIIASTDSSMLNYSRDAYAYSWPRDGAHVLWPLIRLGYQDEAYRFFEFSKRGMHPSGYLMHKYRADGALGSSWHPYVHGEIIAPPIQEDETALVVFMLVEFYKANPNLPIVKDFYKSFIEPAAEFMAGFIDETTGLPKPSYDLWEQTFLTSTYSTATIYAALIAASEIASDTGDDVNAVKWRNAAEDIQEASRKYFYNEDKQVFRRGIKPVDHEHRNDDVIDNSAVFGAYMFGLFASDSHEVLSSVETIKEVFELNNGKIGLPRYQDDYYRRSNPDVTGNYWFVTSFWLAQYYAENNRQDEAIKILDWAQDLSLSTGVMSEQIDPETLRDVSPAPLTWSHAEYVSTLLDLIGHNQ